jgi:hypothetical protein
MAHEPQRNAAASSAAGSGAACHPQGGAGTQVMELLTVPTVK